MKTLKHRFALIFAILSSFAAMATPLGTARAEEGAARSLADIPEGGRLKASPEKEKNPDQAQASGREPASYRPPTLQKKLEKKEKPNEVPEQVSPPSPVSTDAAPTEEPREYGLTGDWGGRRQKLEELGLGLSLVYKGEASRVLSGGQQVHTSFYENLDIKAAIDAEKAFGWSGTSFFLYGLGNKGADAANTPTAYVGDEQGTTNIETPTDGFRLYEAWVQKMFFEDRMSVLFGLHNLNSEFYATDTSALFLNASLGIGREMSQTGVQGPSIFPYTALALRLRVEPSKHFYVQTAAFNAQAGEPNAPKGTHIRAGSGDGLLVITEAGILGSEEAPAKYAIGTWTYTRTFDHLSETVTDSMGNSVPKQVSSSGTYLLLDRSFTKSLSAFVRYGVATTQSNPIKDCLSGGFVVTGLLGFRPDDKLGLAFTRVTPGGEQKTLSTAGGSNLKPAETTVELSYRIEVGHGIAAQPDFQYVMSPSMDETIKDAKVGGVRLEVSF